jgi:tetratricopeptide (TPR) repeat protein
LPRSLRQPVWFQLGNAEFRLGEPFEVSAPEQAAEFWRRCCADYRAVLERNSRHSAARQNLALVERRLAKLTQRLGNDLRALAERQPLDDAIAQLRAATEYLREAQSLAPTDTAIRQDRSAAEQRLQERLRDRAQQAETRGDQAAAQQSAWADPQAEQAYREALTDLDEARRQATAEDTKLQSSAKEPPSNPAEELAVAHDRVQQKLADLLTRMGQREQKAATDQAQGNPDEAWPHFDQALENFQAAQAVQPDHAAARRGEQEVKAALEQLHMREGRQRQAQGMEAAPNNAPRAARELTAALSHFEATLALNPENREAEQRAAEVRALLPDLLTRVGQQEARAGEQAEPNDTTKASMHYETAQSAFEGALEVAPAHAPAQKGLGEVQERLARLRQRQAEEAARAGENSSKKPRELGQLLGEVRQSQRDTNREHERERQAGRNQPQQRRVYPDW